MERDGEREKESEREISRTKRDSKRVHSKRWDGVVESAETTFPFFTERQDVIFLFEKKDKETFSRVFREEGDRESEETRRTKERERGRERRRRDRVRESRKRARE